MELKTQAGPLDLKQQEMALSAPKALVEVGRSDRKVQMVVHLAPKANQPVELLEHRTLLVLELLGRKIQREVELSDLKIQREVELLDLKTQREVELSDLKTLPVAGRLAHKLDLARVLLAKNSRNRVLDLANRDSASLGLVNRDLVSLDLASLGSGSWDLEVQAQVAQTTPAQALASLGSGLLNLIQHLARVALVKTLPILDLVLTRHQSLLHLDNLVSELPSLVLLVARHNLNQHLASLPQTQLLLLARPKHHQCRVRLVHSLRLVLRQHPPVKTTQDLEDFLPFNRNLQLLASPMGPTLQHMTNPTSSSERFLKSHHHRKFASSIGHMALISIFTLIHIPHSRVWVFAAMLHPCTTHYHQLKPHFYLQPQPWHDLCRMHKPKHQAALHGV